MRNWDRYIRGLILAYILFVLAVGALVFTPRGIDCAVCGKSGTQALGMLAITLAIGGVVGLLKSRSERRSHFSPVPPTGGATEFRESAWKASVANAQAEDATRIAASRLRQEFVGDVLTRLRDKGIDLFDLFEAYGKKAEAHSNELIDAALRDSLKKSL